MPATASSAAVMSLCVNGKISCRHLGNNSKRRHLSCPWFKRCDVSQVTPQDGKGRGSNRRLTLMKGGRSTSLLAGLLYEVHKDGDGGGLL